MEYAFILWAKSVCSKAILKIGNTSFLCGVFALWRDCVYWSVSKCNFVFMEEISVSQCTSAQVSYVYLGIVELVCALKDMS